MNKLTNEQLHEIDTSIDVGAIVDVYGRRGIVTSSAYEYGWNVEVNGVRNCYPEKYIRLVLSAKTLERIERLEADNARYKELLEAAIPYLSPRVVEYFENAMKGADEQ